MKKVNIWIDVRTGDVANEKIVQEEIIKYYFNQGFFRYKSTNLLYKWEYIAYNNPKRIWIDSNTGLPPNLEDNDYGEDDYIYSKSDEDNPLLVEIILDKKYQKNNNFFVNENKYNNKNICNSFCNLIKSIFI